MPKKNFPMGDAKGSNSYPSQNMAGDADNVRGTEIPTSIQQGEAKPMPAAKRQDAGKMSHEGEGDAGGTWGKE